LEREQAVEIYKQIVTSCRLEVAYVSLTPPKKDDTASKGYQLHILPSINGYDKERLQKIVKNQQLSWKEQSDRIIIYKPASQGL
jgi:hypothetical protein